MACATSPWLPCGPKTSKNWGSPISSVPMPGMGTPGLELAESAQKSSSGVPIPTGGTETWTAGFGEIPAELPSCAAEPVPEWMAARATATPSFGLPEERTAMLEVAVACSTIMKKDAMPESSPAPSTKLNGPPISQAPVPSPGE